MALLESGTIPSMVLWGARKLSESARLGRRPSYEAADTVSDDFFTLYLQRENVITQPSFGLISSIISITKHNARLVQEKSKSVAPTTEELIHQIAVPTSRFEVISEKL